MGLQMVKGAICSRGSKAAMNIGLASCSLVMSAPLLSVKHRNRSSHTSMLFENGEHREAPFSTEKNILNVYLFYRNHVRAAIC